MMFFHESFLLCRRDINKRGCYEENTDNVGYTWKFVGIK